jgi:hypothetical protein
MKRYFLFALFLSPFVLNAQEEGAWKEPSKESQAYHEYRSKTTVPSYGLAKVKALIAKINQGDDENLSLNPKSYLALPLREKFTYNMIHAESYSQNCDAMPPIEDEHLKVFGYLPDAFDEYSWSDRQTDFLTANRDSVFALIKESAGRSKRIGVNYKLAIVSLNGKEMVPFLISTYKLDHKDHDILTVLLLLMEKSKYQPFINSATYTKLYSSTSNYQAFIQYNTANEELILKRATDFYKNGK